MRGPFGNHDRQEVYDTKLDCHLSEKAEIYFLKLFFSTPQAGKITENEAGSRGKPLGNWHPVSIPRTERIVA